MAPADDTLRDLARLLAEGIDGRGQLQLRKGQVTAYAAGVATVTIGAGAAVPGVATLGSYVPGVLPQTVWLLVQGPLVLVLGAA